MWPIAACQLQIRLLSARANAASAVLFSLQFVDIFICLPTLLSQLKSGGVAISEFHY
jgi:hypothetical protein